VDTDIRRPEHSDADAMGRIVVRAWQAAYRSIMPDEYLDGLRAEDRASMWRRQIDAAGGNGLLVVVDADEVAGFAAFGRCQDDGASAEEGQLYAINLDPTHWGTASCDHGSCSSRFPEPGALGRPGEPASAGSIRIRGVGVRRCGRHEDVFGVAVTQVRYRRQLT
jgi:hypothetical protein